MRHYLAKLALSTALICGGAFAASACPQSTVMKDGSANGSFQLAQAGGGAGGATGGAAGNSATTPGGTGTGAGGAQGRGPIIPQDTPMRQPAVPTIPTGPGTSSTTTTPTSPTR